jgi:hypothetical protein
MIFLHSRFSYEMILYSCPTPGSWVSGSEFTVMVKHSLVLVVLILFQILVPPPKVRNK